MANYDAVMRSAIQAMLDTYDEDSWVVSQFVIAIGLERMTSDGGVESTPWVWSPAEQPEWATDGLLRAAIDMREGADIDFD